MAKYVFVVGGVYSGTGKGISAASIGLLLRMRGSTVTLIKCDPYLNVNAGTMNPRQHGEVFLCDDGSETDLDLGHYERITGVMMSSKNIFTNGTLYRDLINDEIAGKFLGETVQVIPHVTDRIQSRLQQLGESSDIVIAEIGGTVGDFESGSFYEALRQFKLKNRSDVMIVMVAPVIFNATVKEFKTKPLQNAVRTLQSTGLQPDILLCRTDRQIPLDLLDKVSRMTGVSREAVFDAPDVESIYEVPIEFYDRHVDDMIADAFHLERRGLRIHKYRELVEKYNNGSELPRVRIGIVGKYENCDEAYVSLKEALVHASVANNVKLEIEWINAESLGDSSKDLRSVWRRFEGVHGVIVPGGFDTRGIEGKINAVRYCRERKVPFLGICLGLQCSVIEFARNVVGWANATSREFVKDDEATYKFVVEMINGQGDKIKRSGSMRLGAYDCRLKKESVVAELYGRKLISERHRHHYEVNPEYVPTFEEKGFLVSGRNPESELVEMMELQNHPFFVGTQAHPEFKSRLGSPAPLFDGLLKASIQRINKENDAEQATKQE